MTKINLNQALKDFSGKDIIDPSSKVVTLRDVLIGMLTTSQGENPSKVWVLGQKISTAETLDIDEADMEFLKALVKTSKAYVDLVKGQVELILK